MAKRECRLWIVVGFRGVLLRDTLSTTAREAKIRCVNSRPHEDSGYEWSEIKKWGWRCVPVTVAYDN